MGFFRRHPPLLTDGTRRRNSARSGGRHPGSVVLDVAESLPADFVVIPRETPTGDTDETIGKSALYVLRYASQPVLSV